MSVSQLYYYIIYIYILVEFTYWKFSKTQITVSTFIQRAIVQISIIAIHCLIKLKYKEKYC